MGPHWQSWASRFNFSRGLCNQLVLSWCADKGCQKLIHRCTLKPIKVVFFLIYFFIWLVSPLSSLTWSRSFVYCKPMASPYTTEHHQQKWFELNRRGFSSSKLSKKVYVGGNIRVNFIKCSYCRVHNTVFFSLHWTPSIENLWDVGNAMIQTESRDFIKASQSRGIHVCFGRSSAQPLDFHGMF